MMSLATLISSIATSFLPAGLVSSDDFSVVASLVFVSGFSFEASFELSVRDFLFESLSYRSLLSSFFLMNPGT
jgi:hypothetical protein